MALKFSIGKHYNICAVVFGKRGSGKTYLCKLISDGFKRKIIYDTRNRLGGDDLDGHYDATYRDCLVSYTNDSFIDQLQSHISKPSFTIIYKPRILSQEDSAFFCQICDAKEVSDVLVYIEEIGVLTSSNHISGINAPFANLLRTSRHHNIHLLMNAQRPVDVNRLITAEASHIISFKQTESRDIAYFSGYLGEHTENLPTLHDFSFLVFMDKDGSIKYFDKNQNEKNNYKKSE